MSAARDLLLEASAAGIKLEPAGDKLKVRAPTPPPPALLDKLKTHKADILRLLLGDGSVDVDLPARARQRVREACDRLKIDAGPVLVQFDAWRYPARDLREILGWSDETVDAHVRLLIDEIRRGVAP